jgi:integrase
MAAATSIIYRIRVAARSRSRTRSSVCGSRRLRASTSIRVRSESPWRSIAWRDERPGVQLSLSSKTRASRREVPLAPAVVSELKTQYSCSADHSPSALVFANHQGGPLAADNLRKKSLRPACKRAGLPRIDWHTLRHTHGTLLHTQGTPLKVAQAQLGHSRMATTLEVYTHTSASAQREAVTLLEEQVFPSVPKLTEKEETQDVKPTRYQ